MASVSGGPKSGTGIYLSLTFGASARMSNTAEAVLEELI
jgi:hypothetical protein